MTKLAAGLHSQSTAAAISSVSGAGAYPKCIQKIVSRILAAFASGEMARSLYADAKTQVTEICEGLGISRATFYRHVLSSDRQRLLTQS
jgi:transcriptional regulator of acetoin/glycerol metabolism